jgi:putative oxidoreductase
MRKFVQRLDGTRTRFHAMWRRGEWLPDLFARLILAAVFIPTGWGKIHDLEKVTQLFAGLAIPYPDISARVVGYSELICGALLLVGFLTRLATIPLLVTMIVAFVTAKVPMVKAFSDVVAMPELLYIGLLLFLLVLGAGWLSLDGVISRRRATRGEVVEDEAYDRGIRPHHA